MRRPLRISIHYSLSEAMKKSWTKSLEFERYSNHRSNVVFERQFWQITRKDLDQLSLDWKQGENTEDTSKEQIKRMGIKEQIKEILTMNEIWEGSSIKQIKEKSFMLTIRPDSVSQKGKCSTFCGSLHSWRSCALLGKMCDYCQKKGHFASVCQMRRQDF